jgi:hypothetical protein
MKLRATIWLFAALLVVASSPAWSQSICDGVSGNLVTNCGFETGDFTGWTLSGDTTFMGVSSSYANSGNFGAFLGPVGSDSSLSQFVGDNSTLYEISLYLQGNGSGPNDFTASWNGNVLLSLVDSPAFGYTQYTFDVSGNSGAGSNLLEFDMRNDPSYWGLDDVSVVNTGGPTTPEPSSLLLLGSGLLTVGGVIRRKFRANR